MAKRLENQTPEERRAKKNAYAKIWRAKHAARLSKEQAERRAKDPERNKEIKQKWKLANKDKIRNYELMKNYGITIEVYNEMLSKQNGVCGVCFQQETRLNKSGALHSLAVDHCHTTGKVRGLLCFKCNAAIGFFEKRDVPLENIIKYLKDSNA